MKHEEFAFLNGQLAEMLRAGIPLEGALKRLCETMQAGALRDELERLGADLAKGIPLRDALPRRQLPKLYVEMVELGAQGNDLPGMLTLLADHYRRVGNLWLRLKSLMVYPVIVYCAALVVSALVTWIELRIGASTVEELFDQQARPALLAQPMMLWLPVIWLAGVGLAFAVFVSQSAGRAWLRWRLPGFKEAHLARFASTMQLMLRAGGELPRSLAYARQLEGGSRVGRELGLWEERLAAGHAKLSEVAVPGRVFPPLFTWLIADSGDNAADGFGRAASIYFERARHRIEMLLYAALPVAVLVLGLMIIGQLVPLFVLMKSMLDALGSQ